MASLTVLTKGMSLRNGKNVPPREPETKSEPKSEPKSDSKSSSRKWAVPALWPQCGGEYGFAIFQNKDTFVFFDGKEGPDEYPPPCWDDSFGYTPLLSKEEALQWLTPLLALWGRIIEEGSEEDSEEDSDEDSDEDSEEGKGARAKKKRNPAKRKSDGAGATSPPKKTKI